MACGAAARAPATTTCDTAATPPRCPLKSTVRAPILFDLGTGLRLLGESIPHRAVRGVRTRHPHSLGPRAGSAVLPADPCAGQQARHLRPAPGRGIARRRLRRADEAAVLPDPFQPAARRRALHRRRRPTRWRSATPRCWCGPFRTWVRPLATASTGTARASLTSATTRRRTPRATDPQPTNQIDDGVMELCDGVDLHDPRRAVHARRVRDRSRTGVTARSTTR